MVNVRRVNGLMVLHFACDACEGFIDISNDNAFFGYAYLGDLESAQCDLLCQGCESSRENVEQTISCRQLLLPIRPEDLPILRGDDVPRLTDDQRDKLIGFLSDKLSMLGTEQQLLREFPDMEPTQMMVAMREAMRRRAES